MKILLVSTLYYPHVRGGGELSVKTVAEGLVRAGHEVSVFATKESGELGHEDINGVRVWRAPQRNIYWYHSRKKHLLFQKLIWFAIDVFNPLVIRDFARVLNSDKPDIIQFHLTKGLSSSVIWKAKRFSIPLSFVLHSYEIMCPRGTMFEFGRNCGKQCLTCRLARLPHRALTRNFDGVIGVSSAVLNIHLKNGYFKDVKAAKVIHNARAAEDIGLGRDAETLKDPMDLESSGDGHDPALTLKEAGVVRFGFIGNVMKLKGVEILLEAVTEIKSGSIELWIAGPGDAGYMKHLNETYHSKRIKFLGSVHPSQLFKRIDVAVVPSIWEEPLGVVAIEALAFGVPVIGSCRGGISEMVIDNENGLIFDPDDPDSLKAAIIRLASDEPLRERLAKNAVGSATKFLSTERLTAEYSTFLETIEKDFEKRDMLLAR